MPWPERVEPDPLVDGVGAVPHPKRTGWERLEYRVGLGMDYFALHEDADTQREAQERIDAALNRAA